MSLHTPDLTKFPPRSPRVRLGGYVILPRMLDKGRAMLAGKNGEYHYACPLDQRFLKFAGINPAALKKHLGKGDGDVLAWIEKNAKHKHSRDGNRRVVGFSGTARADGRGDARVFQRAGFQNRAETRGHRDLFRLAGFGRLRDFRRQGLKAPVIRSGGRQTAAFF